MRIHFRGGIGATLGLSQTHSNLLLPQFESFIYRNVSRQRVVDLGGLESRSIVGIRSDTGSDSELVDEPLHA